MEQCRPLIAGEKDTLTIFLYDLYGNAITCTGTPSPPCPSDLRVALSFKVLRPAFATADNDGGYIAPAGAIADVTPDFVTPDFGNGRYELEYVLNVAVGTDG